jgi:hypothetical protein
VSATASGPALTGSGELTVAHPVQSFVLAGNVAYALESEHNVGYVQRIDVTRQRVTATRQLPGDVLAGSIGADLAVVASEAGNSTRDVVLLLQPTTLKVLASRSFARVGDVVARPEGTYVSVRHAILELDRRLATARTIQIDDDSQNPHQPAKIAADPRSAFMYAGVWCSCNSEPVVDVVSLTHGAVIARTHVPAIVVGIPQGYGDEGWITYATGMMASATLIDHQAHKIASVGPIGTNSSVGVVTGKHFWTASEGSPFRIACRNLANGHVQGEMALYDNDSVFNADDTHVYVAEQTQVRFYAPSAACA